MKRYLPHISATLILIVVLVGGFGHVVQAETAGSGGCNMLDWNTSNCVIDILGSVVNGVLGIASWILALSGYVLNFSMKLTLNIKTFVNNTEAIYQVWKSIRDISGMFIIFTLLFAAIKMILAPIGIPGPSVGNLIKTVVMAGILINFSFFIAGLGIDVSNVVSAQLYKVIAPESVLSDEVKVNPSTLRAGLDGGISDIFMSSLKIQKLYENGLAADPNNPQQSGAVTTIKVIWAGVIGIIIMITSAISFFLAALALIVRFVILIFLLGFSPIWLAAYAVPDLKPYADKWTETYKGQLLFMPVYLLLLYFGLNVLSSANLFWSGNFAGASWQENLLVFGINAVFVIVMLNAPLIAAISVGGKMTKWMDRGLGAGAIWKGVGSWAGGMAGRGAMRVSGAAKLDGYLANTKIGNTQWARDLRSVTTGQVKTAKFGSSRSIEDVNKLNKDIKQKDASIDRVNEIKRLVSTGNTSPIAYKKVLEKMNEKEKLSLSPEYLKETEVLKHLSKSDFEAIKKSEDISDEDKAEIKKQRMEALRHTIDQGISQADEAKNMLKSMDTDDIIKLEDSYLEDPNLIVHLTTEQLKKIGEGSASTETKHKIAEKILTWRASPADPQHKAFGWMTKNYKEWLEHPVVAGGKTYDPTA